MFASTSIPGSATRSKNWRRTARWIVIGGVLALAIILALTPGCSHRPKNAPATAIDPAQGYRFNNTPPQAGNTDEIFVILAFSGGGTRAAAFSFGALEELKDLKFRWRGQERPLLDEVDIISSVSGGSFTSAYYGLHERDAFFAEFPDRFLHQNVTRGLALRVLNPLNWPRLASTEFGRIDLAAEYYDQLLFDGKTFRDLAARRTRPFIVLNATDMSWVSRFEFTQDQFDFLASDLASYPVARGVTASSAFPVLLTPLTLYNHQPAPTVFKRPTWLDDALTDRAASPRDYAYAQVMQSYLGSARPYIHVMDGGLADNIGLRGPAYALSSVQNTWNLQSRLNWGKIKYLVVVTVNAKPMGTSDRDRSVKAPGVLDVFSTVANGPMGNYSNETVQYLADLLESKRQAVAVAEEFARRLGQPKPVLPLTKFYAAELTFQDVTDETRRNRLNGMATSFNLPKDDIELLRESARQLLRGSSEIQRLVSDLAGEAPPP